MKVITLTLHCTQRKRSLSSLTSRPIARWITLRNCHHFSITHTHSGCYIMTRTRDAPIWLCSPRAATDTRGLGVFSRYRAPIQKQCLSNKLNASLRGRDWDVELASLKSTPCSKNVKLYLINGHCRPNTRPSSPNLHRTNIAIIKYLISASLEWTSFYTLQVVTCQTGAMLVRFLSRSVCFFILTVFSLQVLSCFQLRSSVMAGYWFLPLTELAYHHPPSSIKEAHKRCELLNNRNCSA